MAGKNYGTWAKIIDGTLAQRVAHSPAEAVKFAFDGWAERQPEPKATKATETDPPGAHRASGGDSGGDGKSAKAK